MTVSPAEADSRPAVDFIVRADAGTKRGGDDVQVEQYARELREAGVDTRIVPFSPSMRLRAGAVVHVLNVDRPFEFLESCRRARGRLVVSPIHHDPRGVRSMRESERGRGARSLVDRLMPATPRELLVASVRAVRGASAGSYADAAAFLARSVIASTDLRGRLARALNSADAVALLAEGEGRVLTTTTGWAGANAIVVPNGVPALEDVEPRPWADRTRGAVVVGRIEPRKRQLELVRLAHDRRLDLTVVGELQDPASRFGRAFTEAVESAPTVHHLGRLPRAETLRVMADSRVLINASWAEVQSLVDIEAAVMGCFVVATPAGHSSEWLGDAVRTSADLHDLPALVDIAVELVASSTAPQAVRYDRTWAQAATQLLQSYDPAMLVT